MTQADTAYAILLRGVNVGGNRKVPMAQLRQLLTDLGYARVRTHLQSGNAVVVAPEPDPVSVAGRVEQALEQCYGVPIRCLVVGRPYLQQVVDAHPLRDVVDDRPKAGSRLVAHFLFEPAPEQGAEELAAVDPGRVALGDRVVYQWCPDGLANAPDVALWVRRTWRVPVTTRNWNTVQRLLGMLAE